VRGIGSWPAQMFHLHELRWPDSTPASWVPRSGRRSDLLSASSDIGLTLNRAAK
jgi:hypothetical protein